MACRSVKPIPETEMKQINELVREAMGYNKERGDTISVANAPFTAVDKSEAELPVWKDPENISYVKDLVKYLLIAGIVAFLYLKVIQPSMKTMFPPPRMQMARMGRPRAEFRRMEKAKVVASRHREKTVPPRCTSTIMQS